MPASQTEDNAGQHAWEDSKENFQPVRDGRKPGVLLNTKCNEERAVLQPKGIEAERLRFVEAIERYHGEDPLEKWVEYIKWTKETFVSGGKTSELLPLLEKCTREFHQSEQYKDDIRYLRVWIMYADCLPDPSDVFSYMMDHNIGQGHALFFIAYATFCELTRNYAQADTIYQKGITVKAAPLDRLEAKFSDFQHRMVRRIQRKASEQQGQQGQQGQGGNERRGLKTIRGPLSSRPSDKRRNMVSNAGSNSIPVFEDEQFSASTVQPPPRGRMVLPAGYAESHKENVQVAAPWMGQTIKQKNSDLSMKPKESLDVMEDPEFAVSMVGGDMAGTVKASAGKASLRQRFDRDGLEEQLSSDPLLLMKNPPKAGGDAPFRQIERGFDRDGLEESLVRQEDREADARIGGCNSAALNIGAVREPSPFDQDVTLATSDAYKAMNCLFTGEAAGEQVDETEQAAAGAPELDLAMTINTKDAINAVNSMFQASFNVGEDRDDTVCLSGHTDQENTGSLLIREDTVFLPAGVSHANSGNNGETDAFSIREDTIFISRERSGNNSIENHDTPLSLSIREDTVLISRESTRSPGGETDDMYNDENVVPNGLVQVGRRGGRATHAPLSPLGTIVDGDDLPGEQSGALPPGMMADGTGIAIVRDEEAEKALTSLVSPTNGATSCPDDVFPVHEDANPEQRLINPFECSFQSELVASLKPSVSKWPGVHELSDQEAAECEKSFRSVDSHGLAVELQIANVLQATVTGRIGAGAYATVYGATSDGVQVALKVEHPPCPWEYLLSKIIEGRSGPDACRTVNPTKMLLHDKFSVLVMPRGSGTLQDLVNKFVAAKKQMDQSITATLSLSVFKAVKQLHDNRIVHNDIKPDNILFSISNDGDEISVSLIDVGRGVDLELLPKNTALFGDSGTESFRCVEMREHVPWLWQGDAYAVAGVIHCLIHGEYMEIDRATREDTGETFIRTRSKLPRSYDAEAWEKVFKTLLNVKGTSEPPDWQGMIESMQRILDSSNGVGTKEMQRLHKLGFFVQ